MKEREHVSTRAGRAQSALAEAPSRSVPWPAAPQTTLLGLQRTAGNRAVERLLRGGVIQSKAASAPILRISHAGDPYEREADRVAEKILHMPSVPDFVTPV
jgi:hypothetical protein